MTRVDEFGNHRHGPSILLAMDKAGRYGPHTVDALRHAADAIGVHARVTWLDTSELRANEAAFDAVLAGPGSPYQDMAAVLEEIRRARAEGIPFLGT